MTAILSDDQIAKIAHGDGRAPGSGYPGTERGEGVPSLAVAAPATVGQGTPQSAVASPAAAGGYRHYRPLADAAGEYVTMARTLEDRIFTGLDPFDSAMRGLGPKELMIVQGHAQGGKTLFVTQMLMHNQDRPVILFTPDESRVLILVKLASLVHGVSAEKLEQMIAGDNPAGERMVREAAESFPHLSVYDDISDLDRMDRALGESAHAHGDPALVVFDYVDLLTFGVEDGSATPAKINTLKRWGKDNDIPLALLHQTSRSAGAHGAEITASSGAYGGEQQATFIVGVRRKRDQWGSRIRELEQKLALAKDKEPVRDALDDAHHEHSECRDTITFNLVKNKRPPSRLVDEQDYRLDADTGAVTSLSKRLREPLPEPASFYGESPTQVVKGREAVVQPIPEPLPLYVPQAVSQ